MSNQLHINALEWHFIDRVMTMTGNYVFNKHLNDLNKTNLGSKIFHVIWNTEAFTELTLEHAQANLLERQTFTVITNICH